jgi:hypothetical protein
MQEARLADSGGALDQEDPTLPADRVIGERVELGQPVLAFDERQTPTCSYGTPSGGEVRGHFSDLAEHLATDERTQVPRPDPRKLRGGASCRWRSPSTCGDNRSKLFGQLFGWTTLSGRGAEDNLRAAHTERLI